MNYTRRGRSFTEVERSPEGEFVPKAPQDVAPIPPPPVDTLIPASALHVLANEWRKWASDALAMSRAETDERRSNRQGGMSRAYGVLANDLERLVLRYEQRTRTSQESDRG